MVVRNSDVVQMDGPVAVTCSVVSKNMCVACQLTDMKSVSRFVSLVAPGALKTVHGFLTRKPRKTFHAMPTKVGPFRLQLFKKGCLQDFYMGNRYLLVIGQNFQAINCLIGT